MTINLFRNVVFDIFGDGVSTSFSVDLSAAPISLLPQANGSTIAATQPGFDFRVSPAAAVKQIGVTDPANPGSTATASLVRSILTVTLSAPPDNGLNPAHIFLVLLF